MARRRRSIAPAWAIGFLCAISGSACAGSDGLRKCRTISDANARLACYDELPLSSPAAKPAQHSDPAAQSTQAFGMLSAQRKNEVEAIESYIPGQFEGWRAGTVIRLGNGQVWQIADDSRGAYYAREPKIRIRRGLFGAFYLEFEGLNLSPRVKRIS